MCECVIGFVCGRGSACVCLLIINPDLLNQISFFFSNKVANLVVLMI